MDIFTALLIPLISMNMLIPAGKSGSAGYDQSRIPYFSFGLFADVQYCDCDSSGTRYYHESLRKLREAMTVLRTSPVSFVVNLGDLIDHDYKSYKPVLDILDSSGLKIYHVLGNHDYSVENRYKKKLPLPMPSKEGYYSFTQDNFRFIVLNGNEISTYAGISSSNTKLAQSYLKMLADSARENANDWNGGISETQLSWMKRQLDESVAQNQRVFLFCHFPIIPEGPHNLFNNREVLALLENYHNIIACFSGHNHSGSYGNFNLIHFVTMKGMVETKDLGSYARVDVYGNRIWITGAGREKSQILAY